MAQEGYEFTHWSGTAVDANTMLDPCTPHTSVIMDANYSLVAHFKPQDQPWRTVYFNDFECKSGQNGRTTSSKPRLGKTRIDRDCESQACRELRDGSDGAGVVFHISGPSAHTCGLARPTYGLGEGREANSVSRNRGQKKPHN